MLYFNPITNSSLILGSLTSSNWFYKLAYYSFTKSSLSVQSELGLCPGCVCLSSINFCLDLCENNQHSSTCLNCLPECTSCRYNDSCNYCVNRLCKRCEDTLTTSCIECSANAEQVNSNCVCKEGFYQNNSFCLECYSMCTKCEDNSVFLCFTCKSENFMFNDLCIARCPVLTSQSSGTCIQSNEIKLGFNFHVFEDKVFDELQLVSMSNQLDPPIFAYKRGKYISTLMTDQNFTLSPFFSLTFWIKSFGGVIFDKSGDLRIFVSNSQLLVNISKASQEFESFSIQDFFIIGTWKFLAFTLTKSYKASLFNYYENSASALFSHVITDDYLDSKFTQIIIGDSELRSFIYQMNYYGKALISN